MSQAMVDQPLVGAARSGGPTSPTPVAVQRPPSGSVSPSNGRPRDAGVARILGLSVPVTATLAERDMTIESIMGISVGTIVEFDVPVDAELTLSVANHAIGKGQAVKTGENFGLRITQIDNLEHRIGAMRGSATQS
jgi:flagellar motor switch protein FliN/FliY